MSYRSFKRVLGETSLERKCRFLFGACLLSLITGSFWWYSSVTEDLVYEASRTTGRGLVKIELAQRHFRKWETMDQRSQWSISEVFEDSFGSSDQQYDPAFIDPSRPQNPLERQIVAYFNSISPQDPAAEQQFLDDHAAEQKGIRLPKSNVYEYFQPVRVDAKCNLCHQTQDVERLADLRAGDIAAIARIRIPYREMQHKLNTNRAILITTAIITVFLAMIASWVIVRYVIVKPLKHLRDVSDEISHGNVALRAELQTGDEFEELAVAFNRMLRHLTTIQHELRTVNSDLDLKLDELAQANMKLYEMNRLKSDFLATMSHELRTPLNAIIGFSDVLESIASLDEKQKRYVKNIQTSGKVLLEMINDILDLAKIESGKMEVRTSEFHISQVITAQCDMARPLTERKNIDLEAEIEPGLPPMYQDQAKVQQILNNLLSNAIKFTPEGGRITVTAMRTKRGDLLLTVADTGVGIADEDQTAIFEKFRQGKSVLKGGDAMTREYSGTGLGLSIVKELCKLLGGEIWLESQLGKGSTFTARLPWVRADQPKPEGLLSPALDDLVKPRREDGRPVESSGAAVSSPS